MLELMEQDFQHEVLQAKEPVLLDFWAPWCGPCKMIAPIVAELEKDYSGKIKVCKINVDENQELAARYGVMSIPTLCLFLNGAPVEQLVGFRQKKEISAAIERHIG